MSEAPERIWVIPDASGVSDAWACGWYQGRPSKRHCVEYTRADLPPTLPAALAVPEVAALVEWYEIALEALEGEGRAGWAPMRAALRAVTEAGD